MAPPVAGAPSEAGASTERAVRAAEGGRAGLREGGTGASAFAADPAAPAPALSPSRPLAIPDVRPGMKVVVAMGARPPSGVVDRAGGGVARGANARRTLSG